MGRLHSKGKGISGSAIPYSRQAPPWLKTTPEQVVDKICKLARKGSTPSQIGVQLRDSDGIAQVKVVTGKSSAETFVVIDNRNAMLIVFRKQNPPYLEVSRYDNLDDLIIRHCL